MIFTTWKFGPADPYVSFMTGDKIFRYYNQAEQGREAARTYAADIFNWCAAKRDYAYADHPEPQIPWPLHWCAAMEIKVNCVREFNRGT